MTKGLFISFEGGEGAGKSTQIARLAQNLEEKGFDYIRTREPGGSPGAEILRRMLLEGDIDKWDPMAEALLVTAARAEHVARTIKPALQQGKIVLCDRFFDSSIAYQGAALGNGVEKIATLQKLALDSFEPDLTLVFDMPVEIGLNRALDRETGKAVAEDRYEKMGMAFHQTIRDGFLQIAKENAHRCMLINADKAIEDIEAEVWNIVHTYISKMDR